MRLRYLNRARGHLKAIAEYIAMSNPSAAVKTATRIQASIDLLLQLPRIGRHGAAAGTRELVLSGLPYIVVHKVTRDEVIIIGIYHKAQSRPVQPQS